MTMTLLATVIVSVVTNWVPVHEQACSLFFVGSQTTPVYGWDRTVGCPPLTWQTEPSNGKYLGDDGTVVEVTELRFDYEGKPQVHRIERQIEIIRRRCKERQPELDWTETREKVVPVVPLVWSISNIVSTATICDDNSVVVTIGGEK